MVDHHPFRLAGGTGGEHHVREVFAALRTLRLNSVVIVLTADLVHGQALRAHRPLEPLREARLSQRDICLAALCSDQRRSCGRSGSTGG